MNQPFFIQEAIEAGQIADPHVLERKESKTIIANGLCVRLLYADYVDPKFGKLVTDRMITATGRVTHERYDPPCVESHLPPLPAMYRPERNALKCAKRSRAQRDKRKGRTYRLKKARAEALAT